MILHTSFTSGRSVKKRQQTHASATYSDSGRTSHDDVDQSQCLDEQVVSFDWWIIRLACCSNARHDIIRGSATAFHRLVCGLSLSLSLSALHVVLSGCTDVRMTCRSSGRSRPHLTVYMHASSSQIPVVVVPWKLWKSAGAYTLVRDEVTSTSLSVSLPLTRLCNDSMPVKSIPTRGLLSRPMFSPPMRRRLYTQCAVCSISDMTRLSRERLCCQ